MASRTAQLINDRLSSGDHPTTLVDYVRERRQAGASWHVLTLELNHLTGVQVHPESIRLWMKDNPDIP